MEYQIDTRKLLIWLAILTGVAAGAILLSPDKKAQNPSEEGLLDVTAEERPQPGELMRVTVSRKEEPVNDANVSVDGEYIGKTNSMGVKAVEAPETGSFTVKASKKGASGEETLEVVDDGGTPGDDPNEEDQQGEQKDETEEGEDQQEDQKDETGGGQQDDSQQDEAEEPERKASRIELLSSPVSGTNNRIIVYEDGNRASGIAVSVDGSRVGETNSNGAVSFEVPQKSQITVTTDTGLENRFNVEMDYTEPDITLLDPVDGATFEIPEGGKASVELSASVDISESSGTASLMIDGSEAYSQELSQGDNTFSTTQELGPGTHSWEIEVNTDNFDTASSSRGLSVNEQVVQNGLSLQNNATAGEYNYVHLYDNGEPVEGAEIMVNGDSIGSTDSNGEVGFEVPNVQEITVSVQDLEISETYDVQNYVPEFNVNILAPEEGSRFDAYSFPFEVTIDNELEDLEVVAKLDGDQFLSESFSQSAKLEKEIFAKSGTHTVNITAIGSGVSKTEEVTFETKEKFPKPALSFEKPVNKEINDYSINLSAAIDTALNSTAEVRLNERNVFERTYPFGGEERFNNKYFLEEGKHDARILINYEDIENPRLTEQYSESLEFETTQALPAAHLEAIQYDSSKKEIQITYRPFEDLEATVYYTPKEENSESRLVTLEASGDRSLITQSRSFDPSSGSYDVYVRFESKESSKTSETDNTTVLVE